MIRDLIKDVGENHWVAKRILKGEELPAQVAKPFPPEGDDPALVAAVMVNSMLYYRGIGLSGPQIGYPYNVIAALAERPLVFFNAKIVDQSSKLEYMQEGCLSFPGIIVEVARPAAIDVRFMNVGGKYQTQHYEGMTARIILHELDHIQGITLKSRVSRLRWDMALRKRNKYARNYTRAI